MSSLLPPRLLVLLVGLPPAQRREAVKVSIRKYQENLDKLDPQSWLKGQRDHLQNVIAELVEIGNA